MQRLAQAEKLIKDTRRKFMIFSIIGACFIIFISIISLRYQQKVISQQLAIQKLNDALNQQFILIHEISSLGERFDNLTGSQQDKENKEEFNKLIEKLNHANLEFSQIILQANLPEMVDIKDDLDHDGMSNQVNKYISIAKTLSAQKSDSYEKVRKKIAILSKQSRTSLAEIYNAISVKLKKQSAESLSQVNKMVVFLISISFLEIFLVWLLIFNPLYLTVLSQHQKFYEVLREAESANKARSEFLANISHEIRTPMTGIVGYAEILENINEISDDEKREAVQVINQNSSHLLGLIDEILDIAKIQSDKMTIHTEIVSLPKLLSEVYSLVSVNAREKDLELRFVNRGPYPTYILTDPKRLKQILFNMLGNAIKFTQEGFIELTVSLATEGKNYQVNFDIKDTGSGIPEESQHKLFKPFEQVDSTFSRRTGGTGLGLPLSQGLARNLGGDVVMTGSQLNIGSTFRVSINPGPIDRKNLTSTIPVNNPVASKKSFATHHELTGKSIMVVDDAKENARLFSIYLTNAGADVKVANNGDDALSIAQKTSLDAILLDIQMPGKDGYEVLKELRTIRYEKPIIALTAHAMDEEKTKTAEAGFDGHLSKPIKAEQLIKFVAEAIHT